MQAGKKFPSSENRQYKSIPPLKVFPDKDVHHDTSRIGDTGLPIAELAWRYVHKQSLVRPEEVVRLPTQMRRLHEWYMKVAKEEQASLWLAHKKEHYFSENQIFIELEENFQLFNQYALDKAIVSCYCL